MRTTLLLIASLVSLLVFVGLLSVFNARAHKAQAEKFLELISENKLQEALDSTTTSFQRNFGWKLFNPYVRRFHLTSYQPGSLRSTGGRTLYNTKLGLNILLTGEASLRDGTHFQTTFRLQRENGLWKVDYIYTKFPAGYISSATPTPTPAATPLGTDAAFQPQPLTLWQKSVSKSKEPPLFPSKPPETHPDRRNVFPSPSPSFPSPTPTVSPP